MVDLASAINGAPRHPSLVVAPTRSSRRTLESRHALDEVRGAPSILDAVRLADGVVAAVHRDLTVHHPGSIVESLAGTIQDGRDTVAATAAIHALARVPGQAADSLITELLDHGRHGADAHVAWGSIGRARSVRLLRPFADATARGGVVGMHAQRVLTGWAAEDPEAVLRALRRSLSTETGLGRRILIETIGRIASESGRRSSAWLSSRRSQPACRRQRRLPGVRPHTSRTA